MEDLDVLAAIAPRALEDGLFCGEEAQKIQGSIWRLLGRRVERFTMGDSSSVPVETAESLLRSICFSLGLHLQESGDFSALRGEDLDHLLRASQRTLEAKIAEGKQLLRRAARTRPEIENRSYSDTLGGIAAFFKRYDLFFLAHEIPGDIDYQLSYPVPDELLGVSYINEYLRRLILENTFCNHFSTDQMILLLQSHCPDYRGLLVNLYEPVASNAVGRALLGKEVLDLALSDEDRSALSARFGRWSAEEAFAALCAAADEACRQLAIGSGALPAYLRRTAAGLIPRIEAASGNLDGVFLPLHRPRADTPFARHIDGEPMEDRALQALIDELNDCRLMSDKIALVEREIHSLRDLIEILDVCFWGDEAPRLFAALPSAARDLLRAYLSARPSGWSSASGWEKHLPR